MLDIILNKRTNNLEEKSCRIAFLLSNLKFGGGERVAINLAHALKTRGFMIDFLLLSCEGEFVREAKENFNVIDLQCSRTWKLPVKLVRYLLTSKPLGFISSHWKLNVCACLARLANPSVSLILWEHAPPSRSSNSPTLLYGISASILYRLARKVVAVSTGVHRDIAQITRGLDSRLTVIFNPISLPSDSVDIRRSSHARHRLVWVGRLDVPKNPALILEACALLPKEFPWELHIIGDGTLRPTLEQKSELLGLSQKVRFLGFQSDPYVWMRQSDLFVMTSDWEGLPTVLLEALVCGLPIVSTASSSGVYDILLDNVYGLVVPPNDAVALAQAIQNALQRPLDANHQMEGAQRFHPSVIAEQFLTAMGLE